MSVSNIQCCEQECSYSKDLNNKSWFNRVKQVQITGRVKKNKYSPHSRQNLILFLKTSCSSISRIYNHQDDCQQGRKDQSRLQHEMMGVYIWTQPRRCSYLGSYIWTQPISCYLPAIMPSTVQQYGCLHQDPAQLLIFEKGKFKKKRKFRQLSTRHHLWPYKKVDRISCNCQ